MSARFVRWLPWTLFALFVGLALAGAFLAELNLGGDADYYLLFAFIVFAGFGAFIASRVSGNPIGWLFLAVASLAGMGHFSGEYAEYATVTNPDSLPAPQWVGWFSQWTWIPMVGLLGTFLFLLFPDGHLPSPRWRPVAWYAGLILAAVFVLTGFEEGPIEEHVALENPLGLLPRGASAVAEDFVTPFLLVAVALSVASLFFRYRGARGDERQQLKWFLYAGALLLLGFTLGDALPDVIGNITFGLVLLALPSASAVAILKYRLYEIDVVINKTVLYGVLAAFISLVYVAIVVGIGALIGSRGNILLSVVATAAVAVLFQPARERARHVANRLVYGKRATPYEVLSAFADRVGGSYSAEDVLPRMARIIGEGTGAVRAEVWLRVGDELRPAAGWPDPAPRPSLRMSDGEVLAIPEADRSYPVRHRGDLLGALSIRKPLGEALSSSEDSLLSGLAAQAGLILRNVRLIEELRASRERIVAAQDAERQRIERNIHDGAQQQLVALAVKLRLAQNLAGEEAPRVAEMLAQLQEEAREALDDLRDLARGIYPPLLADKGLAAALEAQAGKSPLPVSVQANGLGRSRPEVEAGVYFCVLEALQNAAKYAEASRVEVRLWQEDGVLRFAVEDDGRGFDPSRTPKGTGLRNMEDRVAALGGDLEIRSAPGEGTTVSGRVPVPEREAVR